MRIYIIAAEPSSDYIASKLVFQMKALNKNLIFRAWGGKNLEKQDVQIVVNNKQTSIMGFSSIIKNFKIVSNQFKFCKRDILAFKPDKIVLIDYAGLNLRVAKFAKNKNIEVCYYIPPKIWAWNKNRIYKIKKYVDKLYVIFPFEKNIYEKYGVKAKYFGNPIFENKYDNQQEKENVIALLPGSRLQEVKKILPEMLNVVDQFPSYRFIIVKSSNVCKSHYDKLVNISIFKNVNISNKPTEDILIKSKAAIVTSGTATLEAAKMNIPQVVCYKTSKFNFYLAKLLLNVKHISLVNILLNKECVKELIQNDLNSKKLSSEINRLFDSNYSKKVISDYKKLNDLLYQKNTSKNIAVDILG